MRGMRALIDFVCAVIPCHFHTPFAGVFCSYPWNIRGCFHPVPNPYFQPLLSLCCNLISQRNVSGRFPNSSGSLARHQADVPHPPIIHLASGRPFSLKVFFFSSFANVFSLHAVVREVFSSYLNWQHGWNITPKIQKCSQQLMLCRVLHMRQCNVH